MNIFVYTRDEKKFYDDVTPDELPKYLVNQNAVIWVDVTLKDDNDKEAAKKLYEETFNFHHLTIEDCFEARNQSKVEEFGNYLFFIVHGIKSKRGSTSFETKEMDGYLGTNFVVTNHYEDFESLDSIKHSLKNAPTLMDRGAAFFLYQLFDKLLDYYMPVIDDFDLSLNMLEDRVYLNKGSSTELLEEIMDARRSVARLKRVSTRQLEVFVKFSDGQFPQIPEAMIPFYRDIEDHLFRIVDFAESYREFISSLFDIQQSVTANRTNDVMKVLAIYNAVLLPLSLIAGIYGMNFDNMPELHSVHGYYFTLGLMAVIAIGLMGWFWWQGWFTKD